jgi:hypothetical protein
MKWRKLILAALLMAGLSVNTAYAIPELQLYIEGSTYDTVTETWTLTTGGPIRLWVIGDVGAKGEIDNVKLSVAYKEDLFPSISLTPSTTGGYGGFTDPSTPAAASYLQTVTDGSAPVLGDGSSLPSHGIYGSGTWWQEFSLGDFTLTDSPIADFPPLPSPISQLGQINVYEIAVSDIDDEAIFHFDVYNHYYDKKGDAVYKFSPFSHDAEGSGGGTDIPPPPVPEPASMLLLGLGLSSVAGMGRRFKK